MTFDSYEIRLERSFTAFEMLLLKCIVLRQNETVEEFSRNY